MGWCGITVVKHEFIFTVTLSSNLDIKIVFLLEILRQNKLLHIKLAYWLPFAKTAEISYFLGINGILVETTPIPETFAHRNIGRSRRNGSFLKIH